MTGPGPADWLRYLNRLIPRPQERIAWARQMCESADFWPRMDRLDSREAYVLRMEVADILSETEHMPGPCLTRHLQAALEPPSEVVLEQDLSRQHAYSLPHWPTSLSALNERTLGGGYAQTVLAGTAKLGKSMLAMGSAIEAARAGWWVAFFCGENSREDTEASFRAYVGGMSSEQIDAILSRLRLWHVVDRGFSIQGAAERLYAFVRADLQATRLLVVLDSLNRITELSAAPGADLAYFRLMGEWGDYFRRCSWLSGGAISSCLVSELNKDLITKGRRLEYSASLVVTMSPVKGSTEAVEVTVSHSRSTPAGPLGTFIRHWPGRRFRGQWEPEPEPQPPPQPEPDLEPLPPELEV